MFDILLKNFSYKNIKYLLSSDVITHYISKALLVVFIWSILFGIDNDIALPFNGHFFQLIILFVLSFSFGEVMAVFNLPPLLGMLITGFILGNTIDININKTLSSTLRQTALVIILLRAGLELDPKKILRLSGVCIRLSFSPCIVEAITVAISSHILLSFPIEWGLLLGFVLAAVSPAVVVAGILPLKEKGYGLDKGIPTLLMAASSLDDILAISGVMICLKLVFKSGLPLIWILIQGPIEAIIGVMYGILFGLILWFIPRDWDSLTAQRQRLWSLFLAGIFAKFVTDLLDIESAGPLAALVTAFMAAIDWRYRRINKPIQNDLKIFWTIFQPLLFGLIGAEVKISALKSSKISSALICLLIGLIMRSLTVICAVYDAHLNLKEKLFVAMAWLPKATVQAAVGPIALDMAREEGDTENISKAHLVLTIAVLSILITAPLGSIAIALCGPKLLKQTEINNSIASNLSKRSSIEEVEDT